MCPSVSPLVLYSSVTTLSWNWLTVYMCIFTENYYSFFCVMPLLNLQMLPPSVLFLSSQLLWSRITEFHEFNLIINDEICIFAGNLIWFFSGSYACFDIWKMYTCLSTETVCQRNLPATAKKNFTKHRS